ncbi:MAG: hypothetical protein ABEK16_03590 [Candidatus Nanohalobium sp.]
MKHWQEIDKALNSELENFDRFMTGRNIDGGSFESLPEKEVEKVEEILEKPLPDSLKQEKLLEQHAKHREQ